MQGSKTCLVCTFLPDPFATRRSPVPRADKDRMCAYTGNTASYQMILYSYQKIGSAYSWLSFARRLNKGGRALFPTLHPQNCTTGIQKKFTAKSLEFCDYSSTITAHGEIHGSIILGSYAHELRRMAKREYETDQSVAIKRKCKKVA